MIKKGRILLLTAVLHEALLLLCGGGLFQLLLWLLLLFDTGLAEQHLVLVEVFDEVFLRRLGWLWCGAESIGHLQLVCLCCVEVHLLR